MLQDLVSFEILLDQGLVQGSWGEEEAPSGCFSSSCLLTRLYPTWLPAPSCEVPVSPNSTFHRDLRERPSLPPKLMPCPCPPALFSL